MEDRKLPSIDAEQLKELLENEFEQCIADVTQAVNDGRAGSVIRRILLAAKKPALSEAERAQEAQGGARWRIWASIQPSRGGFRFAQHEARGGGCGDSGKSFFLLDKVVDCGLDS